MSTRARRSAASAASAAITAQIPTTTPRRRALAKKVSYAEVPVGVDDPDSSSISSADEEVQIVQSPPRGGRAAKAERSRRNQPEQEEEPVGEDDEPEVIEPPRKRSRVDRTPKSGTGRRPGTSARTLARRRKAAADAALALLAEQGSPDVSPEPAHPEPQLRQRKIQGILYDVLDDEIAIEDDEDGDTKIDRNGVLLGGREYKIPAFTCPDRPNPDKLYFIGTDLARGMGVPDSSYLFRKYHFLQKAYLTEPEKAMLLEMKIGRGANFHNDRPVTICAARNVYKYVGAEIVKGGKYVDDDYYEDMARERCEQEGIAAGEPVPEKSRDDSALAHQREERTVGTPFYTPGGPTTHWGSAGIDPWSGAGFGNKRAKLIGKGIDSENWMFALAQTARIWDRETKMIGRRCLLSGEGETRYTVGGEQYPICSKSGVDPAKPLLEPLRYESNGESGSQSPLGSLAKQDSLARMGSNNVLARLGSGPAVSKNDEVNGPATVIVESPEETARRCQERALQMPIKTRFGHYEPHTNVVHLVTESQSSSAMIERIDALPVLSSGRDPRRYTMPNSLPVPATLTANRGGRGMTSVMSWEYAYAYPEGDFRAEIRMREDYARGVEQVD